MNNVNTINKGYNVIDKYIVLQYYFVWEVIRKGAREVSINKWVLQNKAPQKASNNRIADKGLLNRKNRQRKGKKGK